MKTVSFNKLAHGNPFESSFGHVRESAGRNSKKNCYRSNTPDYKKGSNNPMSKYTEEQIAAMRAYWDDNHDELGRKAVLITLSSEYQIDRTHLLSILRNKIWKHVPLCVTPPPPASYSRDINANKKLTFTKQCFIDAGVKTAKTKGIWSIRIKELEEEAGGVFYNYYKSLGEYLKEIEFLVYEGYKKDDN